MTSKRKSPPYPGGRRPKSEERPITAQLPDRAEQFGAAAHHDGFFTIASGCYRTPKRGPQQ